MVVLFKTFYMIIPCPSAPPLPPMLSFFCNRVPPSLGIFCCFFWAGWGLHLGFLVSLASFLLSFGPSVPHAGHPILIAHRPLFRSFPQNPVIRRRSPTLGLVPSVFARDDGLVVIFPVPVHAPSLLVSSETNAGHGARFFSASPLFTLVSCCFLLPRFS